jgi:hypothetical protein
VQEKYRESIDEVYFLLQTVDDYPTIVECDVLRPDSDRVYTVYLEVPAFMNDGL